MTFVHLAGIWLDFPPPPSGAVFEKMSCTCRWKRALFGQPPFKINPIALDFDRANVVGSYKRKEKEGKEMQGYCAKCRAKKEMKDAKPITMKNGRRRRRAYVPTCGTKMFSIVKS